MSCDEFENWILESQDHPVTTARPPQAEAHLAACPRCRNFAGQVQRLDAALTRQFNSRGLPMDFHHRLRERIEADPERLQDAGRAERKCQLQADFEAQLRGFGWRWLPLRNWIAVAGCGVGTALACWLGWQWLPPLIALAGRLGAYSVNQNITRPVLAGGLYLVIGLACAAGQYKLWIRFRPAGAD